jgi:hypothetical protein
MFHNIRFAAVGRKADIAKTPMSAKCQRRHQDNRTGGAPTRPKRDINRSASLVSHRGPEIPRHAIVSATYAKLPQP